MQLVTKAGGQLQELQLGYCNNISDAALQHIAARCPNLDTVNLYGCTMITDKGLAALGSVFSVDSDNIPTVNCHYSLLFKSRRLHSPYTVPL